MVKDIDKMAGIVKKILREISYREGIEYSKLLKSDWGSGWIYKEFGIDEVKLYDKYEEIIWNVVVDVSDKRGYNIYGYLEWFVENMSIGRPFVEFGYRLEEFKKMMVWIAFDEAVEWLRG